MNNGTTMPRNPYEVLGVEKTATDDEIRKAYRKLARENHPDRNPGDKAAETRFKEVQAAYNILGDKEKREQFDKFGHAGPNMGGFGGDGSFQGVDLAELLKNMGGAGGFPGFGGGPGGFSEIDLAELLGKGAAAGGFSGFPGFGGPGARRGGRRAHPQTSEITVPFEEAALGGKLELKVGEKNITLTIPAGAKSGQTMRLKGQGPGGTDLHLKLKVLDHPYFERDNNDIVLEVPLSATEAILGTKVEVPTISGNRLEVKVPTGTSSGARLRLRGQGVNGGDQYVKFKIVTKAPADDESQDILHKFAEQNLLKPELPASPRFEQDNNDIILEVPIAVVDAILGSTVEVPTMSGNRLKVKVPAGTSSGSRLRLRGQGVNGGDQYVKFKIVTKAPVDEESRDILEQFEKRNHYNPRSSVAWG